MRQSTRGRVELLIRRRSQSVRTLQRRLARATEAVRAELENPVRRHYAATADVRRHGAGNVAVAPPSAQASAPPEPASHLSWGVSVHVAAVGIAP